MSDLYNVLSLGAGVQSSTIALMCNAGEYAPPDVAIFADTQAEPRSVYRWLDDLERMITRFPLVKVTAGNLAEQVGRPYVKGPNVYMPLPAFADLPTGPAIVQRQCTRDFKVRPIRTEIRKRVGLSRKRSPQHSVVSLWLGISIDEAHRMADSREPWLVHHYPLIELGMSRSDCVRWLEDRGIGPVPRSACTFCPFHGGAAWRQVVADPDDWRQAVAVDEKIRSIRQPPASRGLYLHRSLTPLADLRVNAQKSLFGERDGFGNDCSGLCGV